MNPEFDLAPDTLSWLVTLTRDGDRITVANHPALTVISLGVSVGVTLAGVALIFTKRARKVGVLVVVAGTLASAALGLTLPYNRAIADPDALTIHAGLFGQGSYRHIERAGLQSITVRERYERRGGRKRRRWVTRVRLEYADGESVSFALGKRIAAPAAAHFIALAEADGVRVEESRR